MATTSARKLFWTTAILIAGAILAASPNQSSAQWGYGFGGRGGGYGYGGVYPSWGYNIGMPGYYSNFRAQSYYTAPWIGGYESPWYSPGGYGCGYGYAGAGRYPWIWNRHAGFVTRGFVVASPPASIKVVKNPFYKPSESSPSDTTPKTTSKEPEDASRGSIRVVSNPHAAR